MSLPAFPALIVPGFAGSFDGHWQRIWADERDNSRFVEQDDWLFPHLDTWRARLATTLRALPATGPGAILVAHSLGCLLVAHLAADPASLAAVARIAGAVLVAPCDLAATEALHPGLIRFAEPPRRRLPFPTVVIGSRNDVYMPFDRLTARSAEWGAELVDIGHAGHINLASGFGRFPRGYAEFDRLATRLAA